MTFAMVVVGTLLTALNLNVQCLDFKGDPVVQ